MKIHKILLVVVDYDDLGAAECAATIERQSYPNNSIYPRVVATDTREVEWTDDHPVNGPAMRLAIEELFR